MNGNQKQSTLRDLKSDEMKSKDSKVKLNKNHKDLNRIEEEN